MRKGEHPVKIRKLNEATGEKESTTVGTAVFSIYDAVAEAIDDLGEAKVLELVNAQVRTNELNRVRGLNRPGGLSKTLLRNKALQRITAEQWQEAAGDGAAIEALISRVAEEIREEMVASGEANDDGGDND